MNYTDTNLYDISIKIKLLRTSKGLKQKELASLLGVKTSAVSKYETSAGFPSLPVLKKLTEVFDVSADELIGTTANQKYIDFEALANSNLDLEGLTDDDINLIKAIIQTLKDRNKKNITPE